jgi:hypothetical protein
MVTEISTELLGEQLRVARELYQEAVRSRALVADESLGLQLFGFGSEADRESFHAWSSAFRAAMPLRFAGGQRKGGAERDRAGGVGAEDRRRAYCFSQERSSR